MVQIPTDQIITYLVKNFLNDGFIIIVACYALGSIIKHLLPKINNNWIVPINTLAGIVMAIAVPTIYANDPISLVILKGMTMGWASTGVHQFGKTLVALVRLGVLKIPGLDLKALLDKPKHNDAE